MTQHGGNPQEFQDHRQGRRPVTAKFDGMWKLPLYLGLFEFVHNVRKRGKALLGALLELLVT